MYSIQNLTNASIKFQGITISAYGTATIPTITDYLTLSRLSNSGKIRYCTIKTSPKQEVFKVDIKKDEVVNKPVEEKVVETVSTYVEPVVEIQEKVVEEVVDSVEETIEDKSVALFETTKDDKAPTTGRKGKRSKK